MNRSWSRVFLFGAAMGFVGGTGACTPLRQIHTAVVLSSDFKALSPGGLAPEEGGVIGHFEVYNGAQDITSLCAVELSDEHYDVQARVSLRDAEQREGWVFAAVTAGPIYLSSVRCELGPEATGSPDGSYTAEHKTRNLRFVIPLSNRMVYFGHVRVDMNSDGSHVLDATVLAGEVGRAVASSGEGKDARVSVLDRFADAKAEYFRRYGPQAGAILPVVALAGKATAITGVSQSASVAGFELGESLAATEARCVKAGNTWYRQDDAHGACKVATSDLGVPIVIDLAACAGALCEVTVDANADGAAWADLVTRHDKLVQLLTGSYGPHPKSESQPYDCPSEITDCFAAGRARKSTIWRWPTAHIMSVSVRLEGAPQSGGTPSLRVQFRSTATAGPSNP